MPRITRDSLLSLEAYARTRGAFRTQVIAHKKARSLSIGAHVQLLFEDELTVRYQIQEMLRIERIFEEDGIVHELETYNPLVPDGSNWKATMLIEYADAEERRSALAALIGIEDLVWIAVANHPKVYAIADEDMPRENAQKTSSVHFLRFELTAGMVADLRAGASLAAGVDHDHYRHTIDPVATATRQALIADLD